MALKNLRKIREEIPSPAKEGEIVEGVIIATDRSSTFLDLGPKGIGVIYGAEFQKAKDVLKKMKIGDKLKAKVIGTETEEGYRELSLIGAQQELIWETLKEKKEKGEILELKVEKANKGGLICNINGIQGFVPVSQLAPEHYPKLENPDGTKIAQALQKLVGKTLRFKIINLNSNKEKLILSERLAQIEEKEKEPDLSRFSVGERIKGKISGVTSFGAFVDLGENIEALLPEKEIPESLKEDLKIGQEVEGTIKEIKDDHLYITLKQDEKNKK